MFGYFSKQRIERKDQSYSYETVEHVTEEVGHRVVTAAVRKQYRYE